MTSRERFECVFNREKPDRYPCCEQFWSETIEKWKDQGLPADVDPTKHFDFDLDYCAGFDLSAQHEEELISEDDTYKVVRDRRGVIAKHHKVQSGHTPHWLETPIKEPGDWWKYKERLAFNLDRLEPSAYEKARNLRQAGKFICVDNGEPYEQSWPVFGQVQMFMAMIENPEIIRDVMNTWAGLTIECLEYYISHGLDFDACFFYGDMGYRNGTLFGPDVYRELVMPAHKRMVNYLHDNNKKVILHSCGQIKSFIPMLIEVGFDALQPLEAKCDQDVRELQKEFGRQIVFFGNIDARVLCSSKAAIRDEIDSKLAAFDGSWNYIFHSDHSIPENVSYENYSYALELARTYPKER